MAQSKVLFDRFMSAKFLHENAQWYCEHEVLDGTHLSVKGGSVDSERIFRLPLAKKQTQGRLEDLEVSLTVGLEYTPRSSSSISFMLANSEQALGITLLDISAYTSRGPYIGIEGIPGRRLENYSFVGDGQETARTNYWPRCFCITIKPLQKLAICRTAIDGGHLFTTTYDKYNPIVDITREDIFLDVYRDSGDANYTINFVKATVTVITS